MPKQAPAESKITLAQAEQFLHEMLFIRHFEEKCNIAYRQGKAGGYLHLCIGMEPLSVGWLNAIRKGYDYVITAYRDHGHALVLGSDPVKVMAEIMGRRGGLSHGKGGSMHLYDPARNFFGGWGIVGGNIPLGIGLAFAAKYRGEDRVTLCYLGDGAANQGVFFESLNMAGLWDLPIVYIIENNQVAMGTRLEHHAADPNLSKRGVPFGIESEQLDSMNVIQVFEDAQRIIEKVRTTQRPMLVEAMTYRFVGHGAADNDQSLYRSKEEVEQALLRDPIDLLVKSMTENRWMSEEKIEAIDSEIQSEVELIYERADHWPHPDPRDVYANVYTDLSPEVGH